LLNDIAAGSARHALSVTFKLIAELDASSFLDADVYDVNYQDGDTAPRLRARVNKLLDPAVKKGYLLRNSTLAKNWVHWSFGAAEGNEQLAMRVVVFTLALTSSDLAAGARGAAIRAPHPVVTGLAVVRATVPQCFAMSEQTEWVLRMSELLAASPTPPPVSSIAQLACPFLLFGDLADFARIAVDGDAAFRHYFEDHFRNGTEAALMIMAVPWH
jgi:hypothetical protein